jgi:hypothetical protein
MERLKNNPDMVENIGRWRQLIKPVLDLDAYINDINVWMPPYGSCFCGIAHTRCKTWPVLRFSDQVLMVLLCYCPTLQPRPISLPLAFEG